MESELVSGFMTEHAAVVFVFFFLAEYGSIVLMCILISLLFLGGYLPVYSIFYFAAGLIDFIYSVLSFEGWHSSIVYHYNDQSIADKIAYYLILNPDSFFQDSMIIATGPGHNLIESIITYNYFEGLLFGFILGGKSSFMIYNFILTRASFPRIRFDNLMGFCWTGLLPMLFGIIIFIPCVLYSFDINPVSGFSLFTLPLTLKVNRKYVNFNTTISICKRER